MKKKIVFLIVGILLLLLTIVLSGCTEQESQSAIDTPDYVVSDTYASRGVERKIEYVYVEIQNFDDRDILVTVDFDFALLDLDELGQGSGGGGTSGESSIWDDSYHIQRTVMIQAHDIEKIYYTPGSRHDNKIEIEWDYDITASFN